MNVNSSILAPFKELDEVEHTVLSLPKFVEANAGQAKQALLMLKHQVVERSGCAAPSKDYFFPV